MRGVDGSRLRSKVSSTLPAAATSSSLVSLLIITFVTLFLNNFIYFIYLFLAVLGLRCCTWTFSSCGEWGLLFVVEHRL